MRVTNKMIMNNAASNINTTKEVVNKRNKQMTTQKRIDVPSDDPVIAVRSLRLSTTLSQVTQYYGKNIPDANSWLDVTETALINMRDIMADCKTLATTGAQDTYNEEDRSTLITQLESLQKQIFAEGNSDYAGRTVFTGYRTNSNLTFTEDEANTKYRIDQCINISDALEEYRYYSGSVTVPTTLDEVADTDAISDISETDLYRVRLAYDSIDSINSIMVRTNEKYNETSGLSESDTIGTFDFTNDTRAFSYTNDPDNGTTAALSGMADKADGTSYDGDYTITVFESEEEWRDHMTDSVKNVTGNEIYIIRDIGQMVFSAEVSEAFRNSNVTLEIQYDKTGFAEGELRPEYYYNCEKIAVTDPADTSVAWNDDETQSKTIVYDKFAKVQNQSGDTVTGNTINYDIQYTVSANQTININTEASTVFDSSIQRDMTEMITAVQWTIDAHKKYDRIQSMMSEGQYDDEETQNYLKEWLAAAKKECDFFEDNMQKLFSTELGKIDEYYDTISVRITDLGCKVDSLNLTKTRVGDQQETVQELQSKNDDVELSQIIIDYTAAYTAYQASLTAASKLGQSTLLNYL
ncbi:MAG: flagellar hook-associated protein 3 [Pseudobutyrivibrio sp.]|nr:flagellar hook-associated protein 3 [Pseudobutyrivibrio sp.]